MSREPSPEVQKKLNDHTRNQRLARLGPVITETDSLRITVGPRHQASAHLAAALIELRAAVKALKEA